MSSYSRNDDRSRGFFHDLHSFKDYVVYVYACAPDLFPLEDWRAADDQMNVERAFEGLRYGLDLTEKETGKTELVVQCRKLVDDAYSEYVAGRELEGQRKLEDVEKLLKTIPSQ